MTRLGGIAIVATVLLAGCTVYEPPPGYAYYPVPCPPNSGGATAPSTSAQPTGATSQGGTVSPIPAPPPTANAPASDNAPGTVTPPPPAVVAAPSGDGCYALVPAGGAGYAYYPRYYYPGYYYGPPIVVGGFHGHFR
jgi:hypothetical protein